MEIIWIALLIFLFLFAFVIVFGAPYVPTLSSQQETAFKLLGAKPGQVFYDLGCGDGRVLAAAAKAGLSATGYEINPILALVAWVRTRRYHGQVKVIWGNFWKADISDADLVFVFLIERYMKRLDRYLRVQLNGKRAKVVSYGFEIPGREPVKEKNALYLYTY